MIADFDSMTDEEYLEHYGTPRHSGRYPWGSGDNPYQHEKWFLNKYRELRESGLSEAEIVKAFNLDGEDIKSIKELRMKNSIYSEDDRLENIKRAQRLRAHGYGLEKIAEMMGAAGESTVRGWLKQGEEEKISLARETANKLEEELKKKKYLNVGAGVELELGIKKDKLDTALYILKEKGYFVDNIYVPQVTDPNNKTTFRVLAPPGTTKPEIYQNKDQIQTINLYSPDNGSTFRPFQYPESVDSKRVQIVYAEEGGKDKDGVIELRRGVEDISLGGANYAQVRIMVDGTHYLKGMAMYSDNMPDGVDILFNTNKHLGTPKEDVFKELKRDKTTGEIDRDNPFGATIQAGPKGQREYIGEDGKKHLSKINVVNAEGDWDSWSKTLSSQFLAKQDISLIKQQLKATSDRQHQEFNEIMSLENASVRKALLKEFADDCDASAVHLKAVSLPRQSSKVILPLTSLKDTEVYAPTYKDGEQLALIRHPHAGTFEIPILTVNNRNKQGRSLLANTRDAIGINSKVAERLSGADFDGDSVVCIPISEKARIKNSDPLPQLKDFDPKEAYPGYPGMKKMKPQTKQNEMGRVSNLITDMTIGGAREDEIARAVKHSMVVIDAEKHNLDYKRSEKENNIKELRDRYQTRIDPVTGEKKQGANTLMSRAKNPVYINERELVNKEGKRAYGADPETGEYLWRETGRTYTTYDKKTGKPKEKVAQQKLGQMELTNDARTLSSGTVKEEAYARYANDMKALAKEARKAYYATKPLSADPVAKVKYKGEVDTLKQKLERAEKNRPKERQAQLVANIKIEAKLKDNPDLKDDKDHFKKLKNQALQQARAELGANKRDVQVEIEPKEWEAIQARAISPTTLDKILSNTDMDKVRDYATPKNRKTMTSSMISRAKAMNASGNYTTAEIAQALGVSVSTISNYVKEE